MPNTVITGPILDSFGQPVNGYLYGAHTARSVIDGALVTQTVVKGRVIEGTPFLDDGVTPLEVPSTVVDAEAFEWVEDFRPYRKQVTRFTTIPSAGPVSYGDLQDVKQPAESSTWIVPGWARELVDANNGIEASVAHVDEVKSEIDTTVAGFGETVTEAQQTIADAAAEVEAFAGTNNSQVANFVTAPGPTKDALSGTFVTLAAAAKNPDLLIAGAVTGDPITSAAVVWPDGKPGTLTITERHSTGAVNAYNITYGSPVTKTFTQPTIVRTASGSPTNVPQIVVS